MKLDRRRFFALMAASALSACVIEEEYVEEPVVDVTQGGSQPVAPTQPAVQVTPTQEEPYYPSTRPSTAADCNQWDPSGECVGWTSDQAYAPVHECISWSPAGECTGWDAAYE